ncbi:PAS domain-containing protein [Bernardetia sp.]|uniref:PAS domain-containing protein n=1 Tax=Bernardetia sp. TaxID=1937974 RepID=UPI0025BCCC04|nr:PAS domain-containing protein [Bernardetia sp.]
MFYVDTDYEQKRLSTLKKYQILDTPKDGAFDKITSLVADLFDVPISIISLVDEDRVWFKSAQGLDIREMPKETGLCSSAIFADEFYEIQNAIENPATLNNSLVRGEFGLRFYAAVPIRVKEGYSLGTLCIIDKKPRRLTAKEQERLKSLAYLVTEQLELRLSAIEAIKEQESTLNILDSIYESSNYAKSFIDNDLKIIYSNKMVRSICKKIFDRVPKKYDAALDFVLPRYRSEFEGYYQQVLQGKRIEIEKHDNKNWWRFILFPVYDKKQNIIGISHSVENITQHREIQQTAKTLQQNLDILAQNFPDGSISLIDKNLTVLYTGGQGYKVYDIDPKQFFGKHVSAMILPRLYRRLQEVIPKVWRGLSISYEVTYKERVYLTKISPIKDEAEEIESFVLMVIDITERKQKEIKIQEQNERLKEIAWQQSHEVRRPVATILGLMNLIKIEINQEYILHYLNHLQHEVESLDQVICKIVTATNDH